LQANFSSFNVLRLRNGNNNEGKKLQDNDTDKKKVEVRLENLWKVPGSRDRLVPIRLSLD